MQDIRNQSNETVTNAEKEVTKVHDILDVQAPPMNSIVETDKANFSHTGPLDYYYFHPDHLGSSSYITNLAGNVSQHMEYLPFGETLVDEHLNSRNSPFKYNGKEFDEETGNYYYSARYYDPKWSIFLSVDPLVEKTMDSYGYCYQNPINLIDPDGRASNGINPPKVLILFDNKHFQRSIKDQNMINNGYVISNKARDNALRIIGHGNANELVVYNGTTPKDRIDLNTSSKIDNYLKNSTLSSSWDNMKKNGGTIISYACNSGDKGGIIEKTSEDPKNKNLIFVAPTELVTHFTQSNYVESADYDDGKLINTGVWNIMKEGKVVGTRPYNWQPTEIDPKTFKDVPPKPTTWEKIKNYIFD